MKFGFSSSNLAVDNTESSAVSESAAMLIFGFSLIGLASFGRKKLSKKDSNSKDLSPAYG
jgi:hypothetical protein